MKFLRWTVLPVLVGVGWIGPAISGEAEVSGSATVLAAGAGHRMAKTVQALRTGACQRVEYIESTGTQWIDTAYYPNPQTRLEADIRLVGDPACRSAATPGPTLFGCSENGGLTTFSMNFGEAASQDNELFPWFDKSYGQGAPVKSFTISPELRQSRTIFAYESRTGMASYGVVSREVGGKTTTHSVRSLLFCASAGNDGTVTPFNYYHLRVYGLKLWDGDRLARDFVPCLCLEDGQAGLFDRVSGTFFGNRGTGDFGRGGVKEDLPEGYHILDAVVADGSQWVDTGVVATPDTVPTVFFVPYRQGAGAVSPRIVSTEASTTIRLLPGDASGAHATGCLEYAAICEHGVPLRRFVPCYRELDGVGGLYECERGGFYPSEGTKPFILGGRSERGVAKFTGLDVAAGLTSSCVYENLTSFSFTAWIRNWDVAVAYPAENCVFGTILGQGALGGAEGFQCFMTYSHATGRPTLTLQVRSKQVFSLVADAARLWKSDQWRQIAGSYDYERREAYLYVDGRVVASCTDAAKFVLPRYTSRFMLGARDNNGEVNFAGSGEMAQVTLWDRALTPGEIHWTRRGAMKGTEAGLIGCWPLEKGVRGYEDKSGAHHLVPVRFAAFASEEKVRWFKAGSVLRAW